MNSNTAIERSPRTRSRGLVNPYRLAIRASLHSSVSAALVVFQSAAFALMWSWIAHPLRLPGLDIWLAVGLGALLAMIKSILFGDKHFSWPWVASAVTRTLVLLALAFLASQYMRHGNPFGFLAPLRAMAGKG